MSSAIIHFKGLNGIRAIAALAVVISHIRQSFIEFDLPRAENLALGAFGVTIFFSLSGFLITFLLLKEKKRYDDIDIKQFYIRRILRIWPLYYFYLVLTLITIYLYQGESLQGNIIYYFLLCANVPFITGNALPVLTHFWSLGVEEQFYLFWPWLVKKSTKLFRLMVGFIIGMLVLKFCFWILMIKTGNELPYLTIHVTRFHCMAIGAVGAILYFQNNEKFLHLVYSRLVQVVSWAIIIFLAFGKFHIASVIDSEIIALITVVLILNVATNRKTLVNLNKRILDYLGKISYGIYVYHPLIIYFVVKFAGDAVKSADPFNRYLFLYSMIPVLTIIIAGISYEVFEKRFIIIKERFSRVPSSSSQEVVLTKNVIVSDIN